MSGEGTTSCRFLTGDPPRNGVSTGVAQADCSTTHQAKVRAQTMLKSLSLTRLCIVYKTSTPENHFWLLPIGLKTQNLNKTMVHHRHMAAQF